MIWLKNNSTHIFMMILLPDGNKFIVGLIQLNILGLITRL